LIDHETCQMLPHALPHDSGLSVIHAETLFEQDGGCQGREPIRNHLEFFVAGKCKIVGVAGVFGADGLCQRSEAAINAVGANVRESGRGWRACGR
jgi:hypothetical protein